MTTTASIINIEKIEVLPSDRLPKGAQLLFWCDNESLVVVTLSEDKLDLLESSLQAFHIPEPGAHE